MGVREAIVEENLYYLIKTVLKKHDYRISGVEFRDPEPQYKVDGGRADLVLVLRDGTRLLEIECKRKVDVPYGFRAIRDFDPMGSRVINQALGYAVRIGSHAFATTNGGRFALFRAPEAGEPFRLDTHRLLVKEKIRLEEKDIEEILRFVAQWYAKVPVRLIDVDWLFISRLRSFVYFLSERLRPVVKRLEKDESFSRKLNEFTEKVGSISSEQLAREAAYLLMNKLVFYKILERHYRDLPRLKPISAPDGASFIEFLKRYFGKAIEVTRDFEPVFITEVYDEVPLPDLDYVFDEVNSFIEDMDTYRLEEVGSDIVGYIYEELIPAEERHKLGQFYTPPPIAELIVKWAVRNPKDVVMDPAVGSGTFLVKAYKRLMELKVDLYRRKGMKARPAGIHKEILSQLYADDINPFPAHLTAMNLAMRDVRYPTSEMNVIVEDFFNVSPKQKILTPYVIKTPAGEFRREVIIPKVDAVVANPPYTRWIEIPKETQDAITDAVGEMLKKYGITGGIGTETGIYVHFISYAHDFLKKNGRLGMIISNSWLQADYGVNFANFLLGNFKVKAVIDFNQRLFRIPLVATCVLLLEKEENAEKRDANDTIFLYVDKETKVEQLLEIIAKPSGWRDKFLLNTVKQKRLPKSEKWIKVMFKTNEIEKTIKTSPLMTKTKKIFEPRHSNVKGIFPRGGTGGNVFFYLTKGDVEKWGFQHLVHPLISSSRYSRFYTFKEEDWKKLEEKGKTCYIFMAHQPKSKLPENVRNYIRYGETELKTRVGKTCNQSISSMMRGKKSKEFCGWYDLGDVAMAPIFTPYYAQYKHRFTHLEDLIALDADFIAFIPKVKLDRSEVKALLAYLNSSFNRFYIETHGRTTGGGMLALEVSQAADMDILDIKKLDSGQMKTLAYLFDKLSAKANEIGGADTQDNLQKLQPIVEEIDTIVAQILGLKKTLVESLRAVTKILAERRISRTRRARPEAVKGEEKPRIKPPKKGERKMKKKEPSAPLTRWIPLEKTE